MNKLKHESASGDDFQIITDGFGRVSSSGSSRDADDFADVITYQREVSRLRSELEFLEEENEKWKAIAENSQVNFSFICEVCLYKSKDYFNFFAFKTLLFNDGFVSIKVIRLRFYFIFTNSECLQCFSCSIEMKAKVFLLNLVLLCLACQLYVGILFSFYLILLTSNYKENKSFC